MSGGYNDFYGPNPFDWALSFSIAKSYWLFLAFIGPKGDKELAVIAHIPVGATIYNLF